MAPGLRGLVRGLVALGPDLGAQQPLGEVAGEPDRGGVVEEQGRRQGDAEGLLEVVAHSERGQRIEALLKEVGVLLDGLGRSVTQDGRGVLGHRAAEQPVPLGGRCVPQLRGEIPARLEHFVAVEGFGELARGCGGEKKVPGADGAGQ